MVIRRRPVGVSEGLDPGDRVVDDGERHERDWSSRLVDDERSCHVVDQDGPHLGRLVGSHHRVIVTARSPIQAKRAGAIADAAVHGAITGGTIKHLHWHPGSPAYLTDMCDISDAAVHAVFGAGAMLRPRRRMFSCLSELPGGSTSTGDVQCPFMAHVRLRASTVPPQLPGAILTHAPTPAPDRIAGHGADCLDTQPQQQAHQVGASCYVDFGPSLFSGKRIVIEVGWYDRDTDEAPWRPANNSPQPSSRRWISTGRGTAARSSGDVVPAPAGPIRLPRGR